MIVMELLVVLLVGILGGICVITLMALIYGKDRPTKMYAPILPSLVLVIVVFYWLGKAGGGIYNVSGTLTAVVLTVTLVTANFILIAAKKIKPLHAIVNRLSCGGDAISTVSAELASSSASLADGSSSQAAAVDTDLGHPFRDGFDDEAQRRQVGFDEPADERDETSGRSRC